MNRKLLVLYGLLLAALTIILNVAHYKFVMMDHAIQIYGAVIAIIFVALGVVAGRKLTTPKEVVIEKEVYVSNVQAVASEQQLEKSGISNRELEILVLMAQGLSNQEIADKTYVSVNTVKTHVSNLLLKLDAKRRTQAVIRAREMGLID